MSFLLHIPFILYARSSKRALRHEAQKPTLHKIEDSIASWGYMPCFGAAGLTIFVMSQWPRLQSVEAIENYVRNRDYPEHKRRIYLGLLSEMRSRGDFRPLRSVTLCATGLMVSLPFFGLVWSVERRVQAREDDKSIQ
ncbi:hypothetical protein PG991_001416 [Apiospora marii]|uniref:Uncharacterized protein n=1 Tax=Apiospora marii TaxID=335849 RepID=A0ABR1SSC5_9PEZI